MDITVNMNERVKVKLTDMGIDILRKRHDDLNTKLRSMNVKEDFGTFKLVLDEDGYYSTQLWTLFSIFGDHVGLGVDNPFDLNIIIESNKKLNQEEN